MLDPGKPRKRRSWLIGLILAALLLLTFMVATAFYWSSAHLESGGSSGIIPGTPVAMPTVARQTPKP